MINFQNLKSRAENGDPAAQCELGDMYAERGGIPLDFVRSVEWYRKSAQQGYLKAQIRLGDAYLRGRGVLKNTYQGLYWYHKAAEQKSAEAQNTLGSVYRYGHWVEKDYRLAYVWYTIASNNTANSRSQKAAKEYRSKLEEELSTKNSHEARYILGQAQCILGEMYAHGEYVDQSDSTAFSWWKKSAENGLPLAQRYLVDAYLAEEKYYKACIWFYVTLDFQSVRDRGIMPNRVISSPKERQLRRMLKSRLPQSQITRARNVAHEYMSKERIRLLRGK